MKSFSVFAVILWLVTFGIAHSEELIGSPFAKASTVNPDGSIKEDWGEVGIELIDFCPKSRVGQEYEFAPGPVVTTQWVSRPISVTQEVFRAPTWPHPVDVMRLTFCNQSPTPADAGFRVVMPEGSQAGETVGVLNGRHVLGLPTNVKPVRKSKGTWGGHGGVVPMPGWAKPAVECDPAFRNIVAGMGGVPILYSFSVSPGEERNVILGFCESFHADAARRPLAAFVEGVPRTDVNPISQWGQHQPGCVWFNARDIDGNGRITIRIVCHERASDHNPILNVLWVFPKDVSVNVQDVLLGKMANKAELYVDIGGQNDQLLFQEQDLDYQLSLAPQETKSLLFLLSTSEGGNVPNPANMVWTYETLQKAAADVWSDRIGDGELSKTLLRKELEKRQ